MYRNDLCTWLDTLSPRHAWPPIATSLPVARDERRTAERKQFRIRNHHLDPRQIPFVSLRIVNILSKLVVAYNTLLSGIIDLSMKIFEVELNVNDHEK